MKPTAFRFPEQRLKHVADVQFSNVDKKTHDGETRIRLCNYTDVYNNDMITGQLDFMEASATPSEIRRFVLRDGDVIITKDSETASDIGVPALVDATASGIVCGYHLAQLRPTGIDPSFLFYAIKASTSAAQFEVDATGVTRFGLSQASVKSLRIPVPDPTLQVRIAEFLDRETARIDALISAKDQLGRLLAERTPALLEQMVAELPHHPDGTLVPLKYVLRERDHRVEPGEDPQLLSVSIHHGVVPRVGISDKPPRADSLTNYKSVRAGNAVINRMRAFQGGIGVATTPGCVSPDYTVLELSGDLDPGFANHLLRSDWFTGQMTMRLRGIGGPGQGNVRTPRVRFTDLGEILLRLPRIDRQRALSADLDRSVSQTRDLIDALTNQLRCLMEYRQALITAAVTGQLDEATLKGDRPINQSIAMETSA